LHRCTTDVALVEELVEELAPQHSPRLLPMVPAAMRRHDGNVRSVLRELYDVLAARDPRRRQCLR
jgi:hypothetical protein